MDRNEHIRIKEYMKKFDDLTTEEVAKFIMSEIKYKDKCFFPYNSSAIIDFMIGYFRTFIDYLIDNSNLDKKKCNELKNNPNSLVNYLLNNHKDVETTIYIFLFIEQNFKDNEVLKHSTLLFIWLGLDLYYQKRDLTEDDYNLLRKVYQNLTVYISELKKDNISDEKDILEIEIHINRRIAGLFFKLSYFTQAIIYYKKVVKLIQEQQIDNSELIPINEIVQIILAYDKIGKYETVGFLNQLMKLDRSLFDLTKNYKLSNQLWEGIGIKLNELHDIKIVSFSLGDKEIYKIDKKFGEPDSIKENNLSNTSKPIVAKLSEILLNSSNKLKKEEAANQIFSLNEEIRNVEDEVCLKEVLNFLKQINNNLADKYLEIRINLLADKYLYLIKDKKIATNLISKIQLIKSLKKDDKTFWLVQYIRFISLIIDKKPDYWIKIVQDLAFELSNLNLNLFLENRSDDTILYKIQVNFEKLFYAIILNIQNIEAVETLYQGNFKESKYLNSISKYVEFLLQLLWTIAKQKIEFFNCSAKDKFKNNKYNQKAQKINSELKKGLYDLLIKNENTISELKSLSSELQHDSIVVMNETNYSNSLFLPTSKSYIYLLLSKKDNERLLISISFDPYGFQDKNKIKFNYHISNTFSIHEDIYNKMLSGLGYKINGVSDIIKKGKIKEFYDELIFPFSDYCDLVAQDVHALELLFADTNPLEEKEREDAKIWCDSFIYHIPIEYLKTSTDTHYVPLGVRFNISYVLKNDFPESIIQIKNGICIFSEIPEQVNFKFLENAKKERIHIESIFKNNNIAFKSYTNNQANFVNLKSCLIKKPNILHFITHGKASHNLPSETFILLLAPDSKNTDVFLTYLDIQMLDLSYVDLVVLSACETSVSEIHFGGTINSIATAFLDAGVKYVLATRSEVNDKYTSIFIPKFYEYLIKTRSVANSLRLTREHFHLTKYIDFNQDNMTENDLISSSMLFLSKWCIWS